MKIPAIAVPGIALILLGGCSRRGVDAVEAAENPTGTPVGYAAGSSGGPAAGPVAGVPYAATSPTAQAQIPAGTNIRVRLQTALDTRTNRVGDRFTAVLDDPIVSGDRIILPKGTLFDGHVTRSKDSGRFKGRALLAVKLDSFSENGQTYLIRSTSSARTSHKKHGLAWIGGGSAGGAAIGALAGGGTGALIGAGAGAAAGTAGSAITGKRHVHLAAEYPLRFSLADPVTLN